MENNTVKKQPTGGLTRLWTTIGDYIKRKWEVATCQHDYKPLGHNQLCSKCDKIKYHKCKDETERVDYLVGTSSFIDGKEIEQRYHYYKYRCSICGRVNGHSGSFFG